MTDLTLQEAVAEVAKFGRIIKGLEKLTETAQALQGAEQLITERKAQADALLPVIDEREGLVAKRTAEVADAEAKAADIISAATAKADEILAEARAAVKAEAELAAVDLGLKRADLAEATDALAAIQAQTIEAQAALDDLTARITAANEARRKIIAGEA